MRDNLSHARGWFLKADSDLATARRLVEGGGPYDTACFHAQQGAEKLLKGFLALKDQPIPRSHNLEDLGRLCSSVEFDLDLAEDDLASLTPYAVEVRYDFEFWPDLDSAEDALETALKVRQSVMAVVPEKARP